MRILLWHVHGSWTTAFVQGGHEYVVPVTPQRNSDGLGRARTWTWPDNVVEVAPDQLRDIDLDAVVLQRPRDLDLVRTWAGRVAGRDLPAVYLEHNTPTGDVPLSLHPLADQSAVPIVHVTHFNRLMWDCGTAETHVVEHGVIDPGYRYSGKIARAAVAVNDPVSRGRFVGTDLLSLLSQAAPLDVFGMRVTQLDAGAANPLAIRTFEDLPQHQLHAELVRRRVYLHTTRWTSLGLSLIEAMMLGMPVVALGTTEAHRAIPPGAGVLSCDPAELAIALRLLVNEPALARETGVRARRAAVERFGLTRFLEDWDAILRGVTAGSTGARPRAMTR